MKYSTSSSARPISASTAISNMARARAGGGSWTCSTRTARPRPSAPAAARSNARPLLAQRRGTARAMKSSAHGWRWESHAGMSEDVERERIAWTVAAITRGDGRAPGRLAHPLGGLAQHAPAAHRGRRLSLRQRRLQRRPALHARDRRAPACRACPMRSTPTTCSSSNTNRFARRRGFRQLCPRRLRLAAPRGRARAEDDVDRASPADDRPPRPHRRARAHPAGHSRERRRLDRADGAISRSTGSPDPRPRHDRHARARIADREPERERSGDRMARRGGATAWPALPGTSSRSTPISA